MSNLLLLFLLVSTHLTPVLSDGRIRPAGTVNGELETLNTVPTREGEWIPLAELPSQNQTLYSDEIYSRLRTGDQSALIEGYRSLEGAAYQKTMHRTLRYPTLNQLKWEYYCYHIPFSWILFTLYLTATLFFLFSRNRTLFFIAFALHTFLLFMRIYILKRPPVSNMSETILYVPWITVLASLAFVKKRTLLFSASLSATALLLFLPPHHAFENVAAVLDSSYWLLIHVLLVVGSYGIFFLAGILAHIYLVKPEPKLTKPLLQTLYIGTALLITGTILGGVWAQQSWGRFWDWDPKEAWAFISSGVYLIWIHAYRFKKIGPRTLAVGAIIGLMAITFTWYGVNYILGTGLHSYGFGNGGEKLYYGYLIGEIAFLFSTFLFTKKTEPVLSGLKKMLKRDKSSA